MRELENLKKEDQLLDLMEEIQEENQELQEENQSLKQEILKIGKVNSNLSLENSHLRKEIQKKSEMIVSQNEKIGKAQEVDLIQKENQKLKEEIEEGRDKLRIEEEAREEAEERLEYLREHPRIKEVVRQIPKYISYEKCKSCVKERLEKEIVIYRILTSISCIATLMVAVFGLIRCKVFWRDFRQFFIGMWKFISGTVIGLNKLIFKASEIANKVHIEMLAVVCKWMIVIGIYLLLVTIIVGIKVLITKYFIPWYKEGLNWYIGTGLVIMLAVFEFYGEYIHKIWKFNLMGSWILVVIGVTMISGWWHSGNPRC